jgi:HAD superfamily hydrolase (TIGR01549 family)
MNLKEIKLISLDAFDTSLFIERNDWLKTHLLTCNNLPEFDPMELRRRLMCENVPAIETLQNMHLISDEQIPGVQAMIDAEKKSVTQIFLVKELLEEITAKYQLAIVSNLGKDWGDVAKAAINHPVDHTIFSFEVGCMKSSEKGNTEIFQKLIERSGFKPHQILHVGDKYTNDFIGARNAGLQAIHLNLKNEPSKASHSIRSIGELVNYL